ncbi:MAG: hypothetical protein JW829_00495, partial [Pirellulales bacterium]|nr:hypothetical protein [Pirellulales bacterium]
LALLLIGTDSGIAIDASNTALFDQMLAQIIPPGQSEKFLSSSMIQDWVGDWITHRSSAGSLEYQHMLMGMRYETDKAIFLAERILQVERGDPQQQMLATLCVAQFGNQQHIAWIEPLLERDHSVYSSVSRMDGKRIQRVIQLRDIALAALIHLTDQKYADYGLLHVIERPPYFLVIQSIYFEKPTDRQQALDKWRAWRRIHPQ